MARAPFIKAPITTPMQVGSKDLTYPWAQWFKQKYFGGQPQYFEGTHAERAAVDPETVAEGSTYFETDTSVYYISSGLIWRYLSGNVGGIIGVLQAALPVGLGISDAGLLVRVTDYDHLLQWTGTTWTWGDGGGDRSGRFEFRLDAPDPAIGWHLCDGAIVSRLNADGTLTNVTLPDWTTADYLKVGIVAAAHAAASGISAAVSGGTPAGVVTQTTPVTSGTPSAAGMASVGAGVNVPTDTHTHDVAIDLHPAFAGAALAVHDHGPGTLELRNTQLRAWYRQ